MLNSLGLLICLVLCAGCPRAVHAATIEFWHAWPHVSKGVNELASDYSRRTGVAVRVRVFNPSSFRPWSETGRPDLVGLYRPTKRGLEDLAKTGRALDLQASMRRGWYARFWPAMLETFNIRSAGRTGVYGLPLTGQVHVFVYNKELFRRAKIVAPPSTWSELMSAADRLRKVGIVPYAGGFGSDRPPLACAYEWSYLGMHRQAQTYFGRWSYDCPEWVSYLSIYQDIGRHRFTSPSWAAMSGASAAKALLDGRAAMVFTDASFESVRASYKPRFATWGLFAAPVDSRARFLPRLPGGVVEGLVVSSRSSLKAEAIAFARWLTEPEQQVKLANGSFSIPATHAACSDRRLRPHIQAFASAGMRDQAIDMRVYEDPRVLATLYSGVRELMGGKGTPASVARRAQSARKR